MRRYSLLTRVLPALAIAQTSGIIAVPGSPLADIGEREHANFAMKGGVVCKGANVQ